MLSVYKRELRALYCGYRGYAFTALFVIGYCMVRTLYNFESLYERVYGFVNIEYVLTFLPTVFALAVPVMTFSLYENERKNNTFSFLRSLPLNAGSVVFGKYVALLSAFLIPYIVLMVVDLILGFYSGVGVWSIIVSIISFMLICNAFLALNVFLSSVFKNKFVALGVGYGISAVLIALAATSELMPHALARLVERMSVIGAYTSVAFGHLDISSIVLWITMGGLFIYLSFITVRKEFKGGR